ncbi:MAG TPA: BON domain-containing protein [Burkholderiaceae bacterium]
MSFILDLRRLVFVALAALFMAACTGTATKESTGEYIDDTAITTKVKAALLDDKDISGWRINVETFKGVVQLSGFANSLAERRKAVTVARGIRGVKSVQDDIIVP